MLLILEVLILISLSAIFSGLNIALMSLDIQDLKRKAENGNKQAKRVLPVREKSHLSLAAILFANVAVISANSLVLEHRFTGLLAGLISTVLIVIFGEVIPQAFFVRFSLGFCAFFTPLIRLVILITYPISKPLQLTLDKLLGHEKAKLHSRNELGMIIGEHLEGEKSELDEDEIEIMKSTLLLSKKRVSEIMTPISRSYWLTRNTVIDAHKIDEIKDMGWSRIPVFSNNLEKCHGIILLKDLVDIDFDNNPIKIKDLKLREPTVIGSRTALDTMFRKFISAKSHLMPIEKDSKIVGIVTIEDLLEEILGHEIADETDHIKSRT
jgi:metal transporter CNNM